MLLSDLCVDYILGFTFRLLALFYYAKGIYEIHTNIYSLFCIEFTGIYSKEKVPPLWLTSAQTGCIHGLFFPHISCVTSSLFSVR